MLTSAVVTDASLVLPSADARGGLRSSKSKLTHSCYDSKLLTSGGIHRGYSPFCIPKVGGAEKYRYRGLTLRASGSSNDDLVPIVPLQFDSPIGQFLAQLLQTHRHLLPAAIDEQLENLKTGSDAQRKEPSPSSEDLLYKRIAEVKEKERERTLEEITYCLTAQKFYDNGISMIPKISAPSDPTGRADFWPNQKQKLEAIHTPEALEMVQSHLSLCLGEALQGPLDRLIHISKIQLGKLYAASIMYGYFLKRVDERFQLERTAKTLPESFENSQTSPLDPAPSSQLWDPDSLISLWPDDAGGIEGGSIVDYSNLQRQRLRSYVQHLDAETLKRYATMRTKAAISLIEKQTQALFGRPDIRIADDGSLGASNDEDIGITLSGMNLLILEAVAFGSFLWDAEGHVESKIH